MPRTERLNAKSAASLHVGPLQWGARRSGGRAREVAPGQAFRTPVGGPGRELAKPLATRYNRSVIETPPPLVPEPWATRPAPGVAEAAGGQGRSVLAFLVAAGEAALQGTAAPSLLPAPRAA